MCAVGTVGNESSGEVSVVELCLFVCLFIYLFVVVVAVAVRYLQ